MSDDQPRPERLEVAPCTITEARRFVGEHHRHNKPPVSGLFAVAVRSEDGTVAGVGIAGRPVARLLQDGATVELTRVCTTGARNACSMLYGALCRAAKALGYRRAVTYTLASEPGASLKASGFVATADVPAQATWSRPSRREQDTNLFGEPSRPVEAKVRWERPL